MLVASEIIDYEVQRIGEKININRGERLLTNRALLDLFEKAQDWKFERPDHTVSKIIPGAILSGEKLIDNPNFKADLLRQFPNAKGGEMEGIGLGSAANSRKIPWILVKGICDWADGQKNDKNQPLAATAAAHLVHHVLSQETILNCFV